MNAPRDNAALTVPIRCAVEDLPRYKPGKSAPGAVKMSSNEMPDGPSAKVVQAMTKALESVNRYPDLTATPVRQAVAERFDVAPEQVCIGTGSSALLVAALNVVCEPGTRVVYPWRSFESYPIAIPSVHGVGVPIPLLADGAHDLEALVASANEDNVGALVLCSPNNPTGPALTFEQVHDVVERVNPHVLILVDEAYIDFVTDPCVSTAIPLISEHSNVLVMRTFSKVHALAGIRIGYAIGHENLIGAIQAVSIPFGVSTVAQAGALASLAEAEEIHTQAKRIAAERDRMIAELRDAGFEVPDSQANFFFLPGAGNEVVDACAAAGLIVRPFADGVRVSVATPDMNDEFLKVTRPLAGC